MYNSRTIKDMVLPFGAQRLHTADLAKSHSIIRLIPVLPGLGTYDASSKKGKGETTRPTKQIYTTIPYYFCLYPDRWIESGFEVDRVSIYTRTSVDYYYQCSRLDQTRRSESDVFSSNAHVTPIRRGSSSQTTRFTHG
jgi:hypothetical protein